MTHFRCSINNTFDGSSTIDVIERDVEENKKKSLDFTIRFNLDTQRTRRSQVGQQKTVVQWAPPDKPEELWQNDEDIINKLYTEQR